MTLMRVFVNKSTTETYRRMFKLADEMRQELFGEPFKWQYLHGQGIVAIVMDMDMAQLMGWYSP